MSRKQGLLLTLILTTIVGGALLHARKIKNSKSEVAQYLEFAQKMDAEKEESDRPFDHPNDWQTPQAYWNDRYGFQFTVTDAWRGYRVRQADGAMLSLIDNAIGFNLEVPTKDSSYTEATYQHSSGYATVLTIYMYTKPVWQTLQSGKEGPAGGTYITEDDEHVFAYFDWHSDLPFDLQSVDFEIPKVISTFSLIEKAKVDASNRRTYVNTRYGYSIKYPAKWYVDTTSSEKDFELRVPEREETLGGDTYFSDFPDVWQYNPSNPLIVDHFEISLLVYKIDPQMTYAQFLKKHFNYLSPITTESLKINGGPAMRTTMITKDHPVGVTVVGVFIKSGDRMFVFNYSGKPISRTNRGIANRIISSFELARKDDVSQWKTYRNESLGYEFQYPNNWELEEKNIPADWSNAHPDLVFRYVTFTSPDFTINIGVKNIAEGERVHTQSWRTGIAAGDFSKKGMVAVGRGSAERWDLIYQPEDSSEKITQMMVYCKPGTIEFPCENFPIGKEKSASIEINPLHAPETVPWSTVEKQIEGVLASLRVF